MIEGILFLFACFIFIDVYTTIGCFLISGTLKGRKNPKSRTRRLFRICFTYILGYLALSIMKTKTGKVVCRPDYNVSLRIRVDIPITAHFSILSVNPGLKNKLKACRSRVKWDDTCRLVGTVVYGKVFDILSNCDDQTLVQKFLEDRGSLMEKAITEVNKSLEKYRLRADCLEVKDEK